MERFAEGFQLITNLGLSDHTVQASLREWSEARSKILANFMLRILKSSGH